MSSRAPSECQKSDRMPALAPTYPIHHDPGIVYGCSMTGRDGLTAAHIEAITVRRSPPRVSFKSALVEPADSAPTYRRIVLQVHGCAPGVCPGYSIRDD